MSSAAPLDFDWLETALDAIVLVEETRARRVAVRSIAREIVATCRANRERVERAEALLDRHAEVMRPEDRGRVLRLMGETLLYIQYRGARLKCTEDPRRLLEGA